jgi:hypothetical protein
MFYFNFCKNYDILTNERTGENNYLDYTSNIDITTGIQVNIARQTVLNNRITTFHLHKSIVSNVHQNRQHQYALSLQFICNKEHGLKFKFYKITLSISPRIFVTKSNVSNYLPLKDRCVNEV